MENIIKMVSEKTGISEAQAKTAVETIVAILKEKMPAGIEARSSHSFGVAAPREILPAA